MHQSSVTKILVPAKISPPRLILAAKSGPPLPILVPPMKSKQATSYSWMNALYLSWYLILRSKQPNNRLLWSVYMAKPALIGQLQETTPKSTR